MSSKDKKKAAKGPVSKSSSKPVAKPVSKPAAKKPASKPVVKSASKPVAKPVSKPAAKKPASKPVVKSASKPVAKPVSKPAAKKPASKPVVKSVAKPLAKKPVAKSAAKAAAPKAVAKAVANAVAKKAVTKPVAKAPAVKPVVKLVVKPAAVEVVTKPAAPKAAKAPVKEPMGKAVHAEEVKVVVPAASYEKKEPVKEKELNLDDAVLLVGGKKLLKTSFFAEVDDAEERANKKKYSAEAKGPEKPTAFSRRKSSLVEETPEELIERLAMELEEENMGILREAEMQVCTKCGLNPVAPEFRVDKDLGYCDECAEILHLGQTKEARKVDYQMSLMRKDAVASDAEEEPEDIEIDDEDVEDLEEE